MARSFRIGPVCVAILTACSSTNVATPHDTGLDSDTPDAAVQNCPINTTQCGTQCVDLTANPNHCGTCLNTCISGDICLAGTCTNVSCADTTPCPPGSYCENGQCAQCPEGTNRCSGSCVAESAEFCGSMCQDCLIDFGTTRCNSGQCELVGCQPGFIPGNGNVCVLDLCADANGGCDINATCSVMNGAAHCACNPGYAGDGAQCMLAANRATVLSVGNTHNCVIVSDGSSWCWGRGNFGQLGTGTTKGSPLPARVLNPSSTSPTTLSLGNTHACSRYADGTLRCWGNNLYGAIGDGTDGYETGGLLRPQPTRVLTLAGAQASWVLAGGDASCGSFTNGDTLELRCWGANFGGFLGVNGDIVINVPRQVSGPGGVGPILGDAGAGFVCATFTDGLLRCWGDNTHGQLGDNTFGNGRAQPVTTTGIVGTSVRGLSCGYAQTCTSLNNGSVWCWGRNAAGVLGDGTTEQRNVPTQVQGLVGLNILSVSTGFEHTCAVVDDGTVRCWGRNDEGQLGDGTTQSRAVPGLVMGLAGQRVVSVGAGDAHTCALTEDGSVWCWGRGVLGAGGPLEIRTLPGRVQANWG